MRLNRQQFWQQFVELGKPIEVARLSVRCISQISIESVDEVGEYLDVEDGPLKAIGVSPERFFHQDTVNLTAQPYIINLIRAVQSNNDPASEAKFLIVDISINTKDTIAEFDSLPTKLKDLRFIKNEVFFALMNDAESKFGAKVQ